MPQSHGPRREKTCLRGVRQSQFQTSLLSYRDYLENLHFACSWSRYGTFQLANNKGADQTARMRRLVCACVVRKPPKSGFLASRPSHNADQATTYRGSYMSAHVLLNLSNELGKRDKMRGLPSILSLFRNEFNKFNNSRAQMLYSIYHMTLRLL